MVDGQHWVTMVKRLGQDFLDSHVIEYRAISRDSLSYTIVQLGAVGVTRG